MSRPPARQELARIIEHTLLKPDATRADIEQLCAEARAHQFLSVVVNSCRVAQAAHYLIEEADVKVTSAIALPWGAADADVKRFETEVAVDFGAHFIEVAINHGYLKDGADALVLRELRDIVEAADERPTGVRLDITRLTAEEICRGAKLAVDGGGKSVTVAGGPDLDTLLQAVGLVREVAGDDVGLKVDCDIVDIPSIVRLLDAGATRFGLTGSVRLIERI
jgi:deoxyribose-phosphate aldolase